MNNKPLINLKEITDPYVRKNFEILARYLENEDQLFSFQHMEIVFSEARVSEKIKHSLGYIPKDVIKTKLVGSGSITFHYADFTDQYIVVSCSGSIRCRIFLGTFTRETSRQADDRDEELFPSGQAIEANTIEESLGDFTIESQDIVLASISGETTTVYMPKASENSGKKLIFRKQSTDVSLITLQCDPETNDTFDDGKKIKKFYAFGDGAEFISDGTQWIMLKRFMQEAVTISDVKAATTDGGSFTQAAWQTRVLTTLENTMDVPWVSLNTSANQFTLQPGVYDIEARAPAFGCGKHKAIIKNVVTDETVLTGSASVSSTADAAVTHSVISGTIFLTAKAIFELQHQCETTQNTNGFGVASSITGYSEVYSQIKIMRRG